MSLLKQLSNLSEEVRCHLTDEKKLSLTFLGRAFWQKILDKNANFASCGLLVLQFINDNGLEA